MCRRNQLQGVALVGLGLGLLVGCMIEGTFWCCALGIGAVLLGLVQCQKK